MVVRSVDYRKHFAFGQVALSLGLGLLTLGGCAMFGPSDLPNSYNVFFQATDTDLSAEARDVVRQAAAAIRGKHPRQVIVAGEPKTVSAPGFDPKLADPRFEAVERELIESGIDASLLARASLTDNQARVGATGNRRVEIRLYGMQ